MAEFTARYYGTCNLCGGDIEPGDDCTYYDQEAVHVDCARFEDDAGLDDPEDAFLDDMGD